MMIIQVGAGTPSRATLCDTLASLRLSTALHLPIEPIVNKLRDYLTHHSDGRSLATEQRRKG